MRKTLRELADNQPIDLWHCEWTPYAQALEKKIPRTKNQIPSRAASFWDLVLGSSNLDSQEPHPPVLVMAHNVESLIWERYCQSEPNALRRWYMRQQWRKFQRFERRIFASASRVVAVSDQDAERIATAFGVPRPEVVDNGVDVSYFRPMGVERESAHILFLGSLDWRPNLDAVAVLVNEIFPKVRVAEPAARLSVVGRNPPAWLAKQIQGRPDVALHANVADVRPYLARCGMLAVPLRIGGGSRLKILEALACETPVVSTRIGAEGLHLEPGQHLQVTNAIEHMAGALISCIKNPQAVRAQARLGRRCVSERYDWDILADKLEQVWLGMQESGVRNQGSGLTAGY
jgi:glycosyltransferase involved in cell wall biosynthesis